MDCFLYAEYYQNLHNANAWLTGFFPNYISRRIAAVPVSHLSPLKSFLEKLLNSIFAVKLERYFQKQTLSRWVKRYQKDYSSTDFKVAFKSKSYASKNHPRNFQKKVIELYSEKLVSFGLDIGRENKILSLHSTREPSLNFNSNT